MIQVTGHRGARELAPENTLAGFQLAAQLRCHGVEMDVHVTKDGQLVVIHDTTVDRTTNGSGPVASFTLAELKKLDAGNGERVLSLPEALEYIKTTDMIAQIELKGPGTELKAASAAADLGMVSRVRFTSYFHRRIKAVKEVLPTVATGLLMNSNPVDPFHILEASGGDNLHVKQDRLDRRLVEEVHKHGRWLVAMGRIVDNPTIDAMIDLGVDVIGSDRPDLVIARLKERGLWTPKRG